MGMNNNMGMNNMILNNMNMMKNNMGMNNMNSMGMNGANNFGMNLLMLNMMNNAMNNLKNMANQIKENQQNIINNIPNNEEIDENQDNDEMNILFHSNKKDKSKEFKIRIYCKPSDTIREVTHRYLQKSGEKRKDIIFFYNGGRIKSKDLEKTVSEMIFLNNATIMA